MQVWVYPYTLALLKCEFKIPVSSVYEATKIDLQGSGMAISKKSTSVLKVTDYINMYIPSFNTKLKFKVDINYINIYIEL